MGKRRISRELSLQVMYQMEITGEEHCAIDNILQPMITKSMAEEICVYARNLAMGTCSHRQEIDALIEQYTDHWHLERISIIDKNIMRQAIYEMMYSPERIPPNVCINEALEIAKKYSTPLAPAFINGILDKIKQLSHPGVQS